jgi:hypothetical protein
MMTCTRAVTAAIAVAAIAVAIAGVAGCSSSQSPGSGTATVTVTASNPTASASGVVQGTSPTSSPSPSLPPTQPPADFTVCFTPTVTCNGEMKTEPKSIVNSGDGSVFVAGITWANWGAAIATGSGTLKVDNCNPNCAQGTLTGYPATVTVSDLTPYGGTKQGYADMTISAPTDNYTESYTKLIP